MNRIIIDWRLPNGSAMQTIIPDLNDQDTERILRSVVSQGAVMLEGDTTNVDSDPGDQVAVVIVPMGRVDLIVVLANSETAHITRKMIMRGMHGDHQEGCLS